MHMRVNVHFRFCRSGLTPYSCLYILYIPSTTGNLSPLSLFQDRHRGTTQCVTFGSGTEFVGLTSSSTFTFSYGRVLHCRLPSSFNLPRELHSSVRSGREISHGAFPRSACCCPPRTRRRFEGCYPLEGGSFVSGPTSVLTAITAVGTQSFGGV